MVQLMLILERVRAATQPEIPPPIMSAVLDILDLS